MLLPMGFSHQNFVCISVVSHTCDMTVLYTAYRNSRFKFLVFAHYSIMQLVTSPVALWNNGQNEKFKSMALGSTQPLTEMSTGSISWG